jgi:hypothetical protein
VNPQATAASAALREMLGNAVKVGDLLVNEESGEILEWPAGWTGDKFEHLTLQAVKAQQNIAGWEQSLGIIKRALGWMLSQADQRSIRTPYGTPRFASRVDRVAAPERVPQVVEQMELGREIEALIWMTAKALDPKKLTELEQNGVLPEGVARALIEDKPRGPWLQIDPPKEQPPEISHE